jgi:hypothetical protein
MTIKEFIDILFKEEDLDSVISLNDIQNLWAKASLD